MQFKKLKKLNGAVMIRMEKSLGSDAALLQEDVEKEYAELWEVNGGDAYMITRIDRDHLVVCCFEGKGVNNVIPHLIASAKQMKLKAVRFHTERLALARLIKDYKPKLTEYVYEIEVPQ